MLRLIDGSPDSATTETGFSERDAKAAGEIAAHFRRQRDRVDDLKMRRAIELEIARWTRVAKVTGLRFELTTSKDAS